MSWKWGARHVKKIKRSACPNRSGPSVVKWTSPVTDLRYEITPLSRGWKSEVYWAEKLRGIRAAGRTVYDRLARRSEDAISATASAARDVARDFDAMVMHTADTRANSRTAKSPIRRSPKKR